MDVKKTRPGRVGINDVAKAAGVSVTTVSHALNGKGRIDPNTMERVREVAQSLGYRANPAASNLRGGRSGLIGIAYASSELSVSLTDLDHFVGLFSSASQTALNMGYSLVLTSASVAALERLPLEGMILVDPVSEDPLLMYFARKKLPVVTIGRDPLASSAPNFWVDNDLVRDTQAVLDHLYSAGARRIALLSPPPLYSYSQDIITAYQQWVEQRGLPELIEATATGFNESAGYEAAERLFQSATPPDGIHCAVDRYAKGVLLSASIRGIQVPGKLLVSAGTDSEIARHANPPLTALDLRPKEAGVRVVELLADLIRGQVQEPHVFISSKLVVRQSTECEDREAKTGLVRSELPLAP
ncbi:LacI family DNA-binding transcriptional regulator [Pseudomonas sp. UFMG81]|jgi:DNA-binding LacI/PurR family transcriptional regulator|uniref:LacI family DNA-binding transcriptional regulator n=1 Tax=Pseudomonas sp. UFMG81 TaxID=2745936 RepID=UPI00188F7DF8|nr:LacI family DNA-binding transcriptional regulator [Pseudomonas sp. UFMG81]